MTKHFFIAVYFVFNCVFLFGQEDVFEDNKVKYPRENYVLSISLLSLLDINSPSLQVGLDIKLTEWLGIHQELGYINNWLNPFYTFVDNETSFNPKLKNGVKYILEPRFYPKKKDRLFGSRFFIAPSFNFRYVNIRRNELVSRFNNSYRQQMKYNVNKFVYGGMLKLGFTTKLRKTRPIQIVFGLGARYSQKFNNLPDDAVLAFGNRNFLFSGPTIEGEQIHPDVYFGLLLHLHNFQKKK